MKISGSNMWILIIENYLVSYAWLEDPLAWAIKLLRLPSNLHNLWSPSWLYWYFLFLFFWHLLFWVYRKDLTIYISFFNQPQLCLFNAGSFSFRMSRYGCLQDCSWKHLQQVRILPLPYRNPWNPSSVKWVLRYA